MPNNDLFVVVVFLFGGCLVLVFVLFLIDCFGVVLFWFFNSFVANQIAGTNHSEQSKDS